MAPLHHYTAPTTIKLQRRHVKLHHPLGLCVSYMGRSSKWKTQLRSLFIDTSNMGRRWIDRRRRLTLKGTRFLRYFGTFLCKNELRIFSKFMSTSARKKGSYEKMKMRMRKKREHLSKIHETSMAPRGSTPFFFSFF